MKELSNNKDNSNLKIQNLLKIISVLLAIFCILITLLLFKINEINNTLDRLSYAIKNETIDDKHQDVIDVFVEESTNAEAVLPFYDEINEKVTTSENTTKEIITKNHNTTENIKDNDNDITTDNSTIHDNSRKITYVINVNSKKIHYKDCSFVNRMKEENKETVQLSKDELNDRLNNDYTFCSSCGG